MNRIDPWFSRHAYMLEFRNTNDFHKKPSKKYNPKVPSDFYSRPINHDRWVACLKNLPSTDKK